MIAWLQTSIWSNRLKSLYLIALMPFLVLVWIFLWFFFTYWRIDEIVLNEIFTSSLISLPILTIWFFIAVLFQRQIIFKFSWAKPITRKENPEIYNIVENLCISRWLPIPKIWILEDDSMNAFATGWNPKNSWVVFSRWLINRLDKSEIEAVAAHELTHVINWDIKIMVLSTVFVWIIWTLWEILIRISAWNNSWSSSNKNNKWWNPLLIIWIILYILWIIVLPLINLAISRKREFLADAWSVELTKDKLSMINALKKISGDSTIESIKKASVAQMCIENPFSKKAKWFSNFFWSFFSTHPSIESRISVLEKY